MMGLFRHREVWYGSLYEPQGSSTKIAPTPGGNFLLGQSKIVAHGEPFLRNKNL